MEKPQPTPGMGSDVLPPPYSSLASSQEHGIRPPVLATAPYPVTPESEHNHSIPMSIPPPYYYYNPMQVGTTGSGMPPSVHNSAYPPIYNPAIAPPQERTYRRNSCVPTICMMLLIIVIITIAAIGVRYYVKEVL